MARTDQTEGSLPALVVIARAAHLTRDRALKEVALRKLREEYGVDVRFCRAPDRRQTAGRAT